MLIGFKFNKKQLYSFIMNEYLQSIIDRDPAAKSKISLILTYPGVKAIFFHKIANFFAIEKFDLVARI